MIGSSSLRYLLDQIYQKGKGKPILMASSFWDEDRMEGASICYKVMRYIDDLVDDRKVGDGKIGEDVQPELISIVENHLAAIVSGVPSDPMHIELINTIERFKIPLWPWQAFAKSMIYDIKNDGFKTFTDFIRYSEGAAVAPAIIFVHLSGVTSENGSYEPPSFNIRETARYGALFAYLVHIIRDFQQDQNEGLNYYAMDLISSFGLNKIKLREIAKGESPNIGFRNLMSKYLGFAEYYRQKARYSIDQSRLYFEPQYQIGLEIVYNLYLQIFERIDTINGSFTSSELHPTSEEIYECLEALIVSFPSDQKVIIENETYSASN